MYFFLVYIKILVYLGWLCGMCALVHIYHIYVMYVIYISYVCVFLWSIDYNVTLSCCLSLLLLSSITSLLFALLFSSPFLIFLYACQKWINHSHFLSQYLQLLSFSIRFLYKFLFSCLFLKYFYMVLSLWHALICYFIFEMG